eukprot:690951-Amphidinium_carterae.3
MQHRWRPHDTPTTTTMSIRPERVVRKYIKDTKADRDEKIQAEQARKGYETERFTWTLHHVLRLSCCICTKYLFGKQCKRYEAYQRHGSLHVIVTHNTQKQSGPPTNFEGNNKGDTSAWPTTTLNNWVSEVTSHLCLEEPRLRETLDHVKVQTSPTIDENHADARLAKEGLSYGKGFEKHKRHMLHT